ncbi:MAG: hypothetical protein N4A35_17340 [Flavobacteriales bacterium]|jgi:hypothetical protein|nr:hypothetical protein [Flavobacteriales bacterium]
MFNDLKYLSILILGVLFSLSLSNCKKEKLNLSSSTKVQFSQDTILFDTLFTTIGSTTKRFKIYNTLNQRINISNIWLDQGTQSMFRINVDGVAGVSFENVEIPAKDSLFVFVEVTIDPNNGTAPLVVEDKIRFLTNGNTQQVVLNAWGQDAYFHVSEIISSNTTWANDKPHVIYNYCAVDSNVTLTIPGGTNIYGHNEATFLVYKGALNCNGSLGDPVTFQQDRVEDFILSPSDSVAGQWRGIRFFEPQTSQLDYVEIKNALIGIQVDTAQAGQFVHLNAVQTHNCSYAGILSQGANIKAVNSLFGNAGLYSGFISIGGTVDFDHCTFGNYWQGQRNSALFVFKNYYEDANEVIHYRPFINAEFTNSIFYGLNDNEVLLDTLDRSIAGINAPNFTMANCLVKLEDGITNEVLFTDCFANSDPEFDDPSNWIYSVSSGSFAKGKSNNSSTTIDIEGQVRNSPATIGCYE